MGCLSYTSGIQTREEGTLCTASIWWKEPIFTTAYKANRNKTKHTDIRWKRIIIGQWWLHIWQAMNASISRSHHELGLSYLNTVRWVATDQKGASRGSKKYFFNHLRPTPNLSRINQGRVLLWKVRAKMLCILVEQYDAGNYLQNRKVKDKYAEDSS